MNGAVHVEKEHEQVNKQGYKMSGRTWKRVGHGREREVGWEKGKKKRRRNGKSNNLLVRYVTEFHIK